jgi:hypothetical protein
MIFKSSIYIPSSAFGLPHNYAHLGLEHLPEPGLLLQLASGVLGLVVLDKRRRRRANH